jgi:hypothetical protein
MSSNVLKEIVVEWCTWYKTDAEKDTGRDTVGQQVSKHPSIAREIRNGFHGQRIAYV